MAYEKQTWQLGDVITKEKIDHIEDGIYDNSIDKINTNGDSKNMTITGTSSDTNDGQASSWTSVATLTSGETHTSVFAKISQMFKNIRYLYSHKIDIENIVDDLTTDNASKVLSAKQGKILNDNSLISRGTVESGTNLNSIRQIGSYILNGSNSYINMPTGVVYGVLTVLRGSESSNFITQIITMTSQTRYFHRESADGGSTWSAWIQLAKQSEVDTLNDSLTNTSWSGSFVWNSSYAWNTYHTVDVYKVGRFVSLTVRAYQLTSGGVPKNVVFLTVPESLRPSGTVRSVYDTAQYGSDASHSTTTGLGDFTITPNGEIYQNYGSGNIYTAYASFVYWLG